MKLTAELQPIGEAGKPFHVQACRAHIYRAHIYRALACRAQGRTRQAKHEQLLLYYFY